VPLLGLGWLALPAFINVNKTLIPIPGSKHQPSLPKSQPIETRSAFAIAAAS
jgi:hypothetical protein